MVFVDDEDEDEIEDPDSVSDQAAFFIPSLT